MLDKVKGAVGVLKVQRWGPVGGLVLSNTARGAVGSSQVGVSRGLRETCGDKSVEFTLKAMATMKYMADHNSSRLKMIRTPSRWDGPHMSA